MLNTNFLKQELIGNKKFGDRNFFIKLLQNNNHKKVYGKRLYKIHD